VRHTPPALLSGKEPQISVNWGGGGASVDAGLREKSAAIPGNQTSDNFLACSVVTIVTELPWLLSSTCILQ
jgi:hypothetical protein